jgi:SAM-dependent methyltransferase
MEPTPSSNNSKSLSRSRHPRIIMSQNNKKRREEKRQLKKEEALKAADPIHQLAAERKKYANNWSSIDAAGFEQQGLYTWMASFINGHTRVLEIGTGDGRGTCALLAAGHSVTSIDENPNCLKEAEKRIVASGFNATYQKREHSRRKADKYELTYLPPSGSPPEMGALLIEGDILNDPALTKWLRDQRPFDAVVCWLIGSHKARPKNAVFEELKIHSSGGYRLCVQNTVYELADQILRPGGVLHIVDRGEPLVTSLLREDMLNSHRDQASVTNLQVDPNIVDRPYSEPAQVGVKMGLTPGLSGRVTDLTKFALTSVVARKP